MYKLHLDWLKITYISVSKSHPLFDRFAHVNTPVEATGDQVDLTFEEHEISFLQLWMRTHYAKLAAI